MNFVVRPEGRLLFSGGERLDRISKIKIVRFAHVKGVSAGALLQNELSLYVASKIQRVLIPDVIRYIEVDPIVWTKIRQSFDGVAG